MFGHIFKITFKNIQTGQQRVIHQYNGTAIGAISEARKENNLKSTKWEMIECNMTDKNF